MKDDVVTSDEKVQDLVVRTRNYALRIIRLYPSLPKTVEAQVLGKQLLRSGICWSPIPGSKTSQVRCRFY